MASPGRVGILARCKPSAATGRPRPSTYASITALREAHARQTRLEHFGPERRT